MRFPSPIRVQVRSSRRIPLSTPWLHQGATAQSREQCPAPPVRGPEEYEQEHEDGTILSRPSLQLQRVQKIHTRSSRQPRTTTPQTPAVFTSGRRRDTATAHPPVGFLLSGRSASWSSDRDLPTPHHAFFLAPAVREQAFLQQDASPHTEYSMPLFLQVHRSHVPMLLSTRIRRILQIPTRSNYTLHCIMHPSATRK